MFITKSATIIIFMRKSLVYIYLTRKDFNTCTDCFFIR